MNDIENLEYDIEALEKNQAIIRNQLQGVRQRLFERKKPYKDIHEEFDSWVELKIGKTNHSSVLHIPDIQVNGKTYVFMMYDDPPFYPERRETFSIEEIQEKMYDDYYEIPQEVLAHWKAELIKRDVKSVCYDW